MQVMDPGARGDVQPPGRRTTGWNRIRDIFKGPRNAGASVLAATQVYVLCVPSRRQHIEELMDAWGFQEAIFVEGPVCASMDECVKSGLITQQYKEMLQVSRDFVPEAKISCHLGHIEILRRFSEDTGSKDYALIFEDDLEEKPRPGEVQGEITQFLTALPPGGFDLLHLGFLWERENDLGAVDAAGGLVFPSLECLGRHAYMVSRPTAQVLLKQTLPMWNHGDQMYSDVRQRLGLRAFRPKTPLFFQDRPQFPSLLRQSKAAQPAQSFRTTKTKQSVTRPRRPNYDDTDPDDDYYDMDDPSPRRRLSSDDAGGFAPDYDDITDPTSWRFWNSLWGSKGEDDDEREKTRDEDELAVEAKNGRKGEDDDEKDNEADELGEDAEADELAQAVAEARGDLQESWDEEESFAS